MRTLLLVALAKRALDEDAKAMLLSTADVCGGSDDEDDD